MESWDFVQLAADLIQATFLIVGIISTMVAIEYVRFRRRRAVWLADNESILGTSGVVVSNEDGFTVLDNGVRVPAQKVAGAWKYRHLPGERVEVIGYPTFQNISAEPPLTAVRVLS